MSEEQARQTGEVALERDAVGQYLHGISRLKLLTAEQEVRLAMAIEAGLYAEQCLENMGAAEARVVRGEKVTRDELLQVVKEGQRARELFLESNVRLVISIARRYVRDDGMPFEDLIQHGNTGLVRAIEKFDYTKGFKFSTYATWWIKQSITRAIAQEGRAVRLPVHLVEEVNRMKRVERELMHELDRLPTVEELAEALGISPVRVRELKDRSQDIVSLDTPIGDDGRMELGDLVVDDNEPSTEDLVVEALMRVILEEAIDSTLSAREARIVRLRHGLEDGVPHTLDYVAAEIGVTRERIRQIELKARPKLKAALEARGIDRAA